MLRRVLRVSGVVTLDGTRQLLVFSASRLMGSRPAGGQLLWEYPWTTQFDVNASQPLVIGDNRLFISTGYGAGAAVIELSRSPRRSCRPKLLVHRGT